MTRARGRRVMTETSPEVGDTANEDSETRDVEFYNNHEGLRGRDPNVMYLDVAERIHGAENARALGFDVEVDDLGKLPVTAGTPLVTKANLGDNVMSHPSTPLLENNDVIKGTDPIVTATVPVETDAGLSPFSGTVASDLSEQETPDAGTEVTGSGEPVGEGNPPHSDFPV